MTVAADIVRQLGVHRTVACEWLKLAKAGEGVHVKRLQALAISAIAQVLKPWDKYERKRHAQN